MSLARPSTPRSARPSYLRSLSSTHLVPQANKPRLYLALYPRGSGTSSFHSASHCDSFHWSLVIGPQTSSRKDVGTRYHVSHSDSQLYPFLYEESDLLASGTHVPLLRITLAKVRDTARLTALLRTLPVPPGIATTDTCLSWTRAAFELLTSDKGNSQGGDSAGPCLSSYLKPSDWERVENKARKYHKKKRDLRRFDTERQHGSWDPTMVCTWNFWENRETTA